MTAPFAVGGVGPAAPNPAFEALGASPAAGASSNSAVDPSLLPFSGVLARLVSLQATSDTGPARAPGSMVQDALASLEAAISDAASAGDAGTAAIRALIEQVTRQGGATAATKGVAELPVTSGMHLPAVDAATQALGAAAVIALPAAPLMAPAAATQTRDASSTPSSEDDGKAARTGGDADGATLANARSDALDAHAPVIDPSAVVRDASALDPAFRARLDRVIERMQDEFGHKVTIVETVRSQARQDTLFEQGRTAPGQVVTWTRTSRHADGMAVDLMIDGSYDNPVAFQRLQRIANEEGLHTLGSRDPGHLEMRIPQSGGFTARMASGRQNPLSLPASAATATPISTAATASAAHDAIARITRVAQVAQVAVTAGVARVAQVARVAVAGAASAPPAMTAQATSTTTNNAASAAQAGRAADATTAPTPNASATGDRPGAARTAGAELPTLAVKGGDATTKSSTRERSTDNEGKEARRAMGASSTASEPQPVAFVPSARGASAVAPTGTVAGPDQAARVGQIDALQEQAASRPVSSMVLNLDDGNGGTDRIRVDVRGVGVSSTIDVRDQQAASEMATRTGELARALESHGLESDGVRIRAVSQGTGTDALRQATVGDAGTTRSLAGALGAEASHPSRRDRDEARDSRANWAQQQQDSHRERSRREREEQQP